MNLSAISNFEKRQYRNKEEVHRPSVSMFRGLGDVADCLKVGLHDK